MSESQQSDALKKLVLFIVALAILGTIIALVLYFGMVLPAQHAGLTVPTNGIMWYPHE